MKNISTKIDELLFEKRSQQEKQILKYLKEHLNDLPNQNLAKVADNNFCSTTSVTRIVKKLGFAGYKEFQIALKIKNDKKSSTKEEIPNLNKVIEKIKNVPCLYIYGKGASQISALHLFRQLIKAGIDVSLIQEQDLLYSLNNKTIICLSNSGETKSIVDLFKELKEYNNCEVIAITKEKSTLNKISDLSLTHNYDISKTRENQVPFLEIIDKLSLEIQE